MKTNGRRRCQVRGSRCAGARRDSEAPAGGLRTVRSEKNYVPSRNVYENKQHSPKSGIQTKHFCHGEGERREILTFQAGMRMKTKVRQNSIANHQSPFANALAPVLQEITVQPEMLLKIKDRDFRILHIQGRRVVVSYLLHFPCEVRP